MSLSSLITSFENAVATTEADVQSWVAQIQAAIPVVEADVQYGLNYIANNAGNWIADLRGAEALAALIPGLQLPASVATLITEAITALQSVQASVAKQTPTGTTLVAAYNAVANVKQATATVLQVVSTPATAPVPAAS